MAAATRRRATPGPAPLTSERAADELAAARAAADAVLDRISAGEQVEPGELLDAEAAVRMAEVRIELGARNEAAAAERARMDRFRQLVDSLAGPGQREKAGAVMDAYRAAEKALLVLLEAAQARQEGVSDDLREIGRLARAGDVPDGVDVELDYWGCQALTANGVRVQAGDFQDDPHVLVRDVAAAVVASDSRTSAHGNELVGIAGSYRTVRLERLEQLAGTPAEDGA